jgi:hypothetical protein
MCQSDELEEHWPPSGWRAFDAIDNSHAQTVIKDPASSLIMGFSYDVKPVQIYRTGTGKPFFAYEVSIIGWEYNILNESREYSILSFVMKDRLDHQTPSNFLISDIKVRARPLKLTQRSAHRALAAAIFMMKQIKAGNALDVGRILRLYKIHPSQRSLYDIDNQRQDSLYCGLSDTRQHH